MEAGESHAFFGLDLFVAIEWSDLHLRTLQGWQVLHFTFESAKTEKQLSPKLHHIKDFSRGHHVQMGCLRGSRNLP
jgi:hypothetical protein